MTAGRLRTLEPATYRRLDRIKKLLGVVLVAAGLEVGGGTPMGLALGVSGAIVALCTLAIPLEDEAEDAQSQSSSR